MILLPRISVNTGIPVFSLCGEPKQTGGEDSLQQLEPKFGGKDSRAKDLGFEIDFLRSCSSLVARRKRGVISRSPLPSLELTERS